MSDTIEIDGWQIDLAFDGGEFWLTFMTEEIYLEKAVASFLRSHREELDGRADITLRIQRVSQNRIRKGKPI